MALKTLLELRTGSRQRADLEEDGNVIDDVEANDYVNESVAELWDLVVEGDGAQLFAKNAPILTKTGDNSYILPSDFYKLVSVSYSTGGEYVQGQPFDSAETAVVAANPPTPENFVYSLRLGTLALEDHIFTFPALDEDKLAVVYIPESPILSADTDSVDGINYFHSFVMYSAASKMVDKVGLDSTHLLLRLRRLEERIRHHIRTLDGHYPAVIREVSSHIGHRHG